MTEPGCHLPRRADTMFLPPDTRQHTPP